MKKVLIVILGILFFCRSEAQVLIINMTLGECVKCGLPLSFLQVSKTGIPTYVIFPAKYAERSGELEELYHFKDRQLTPVFNDSLLIQFPQFERSSSVYFVAGDSVLYRTPLIKVDENTVRKIINIDQSIKALVAKDDETVKLVGNELYAYNYYFNDVTRRSESDTHRYQCSVSDIEKIYKRQNCFPNDNPDDVKNLVKTNTEFKPAWSAFGFTNDRKLIVLGHWYIPMRNTRNARILDQRYGLFCFKNDKLQSSHLIFTDPRDSLWTLDRNLVYPVSEEEVMLSYYPGKVVPDSSAKQYYMAVFRLSEGCYKYSHHLNPKLTTVYRNCVGNSGIGYFAMDDRFVCLSATNEVQDYMSNASYQIPFEKLGKLIDCRPSDRMKTLEQIFNFSLAHKGNELFLLSRINWKKYCIVYDHNSREMTNYFEYSRIFPATKVGANFLIDIKKNAITIPDEATGKCRMYPLTLIYSKAS